MRIGLLGTVEAHRGADPLPVLGLRLRGLLARLALDADRPVPASVLVDDLWGEAAPDGAGNALQALVSRLRRAVGAELVGTEAGGYRLRVPPDARPSCWGSSARRSSGWRASWARPGASWSGWPRRPALSVRALPSDGPPSRSPGQRSNWPRAIDGLPASTWPRPCAA